MNERDDMEQAVVTWSACLIADERWTDEDQENYEAIIALIRTAPDPENARRLVDAVREMAKNGVAEYSVYSSIAGDPSPIYKVHKSDIEKVEAALAAVEKDGGK